MKWLSAAEFQYNDKKHAAIEYIPFKLWKIPMKRRPNNKNKVIKTRDFS